MRQQELAVYRVRLRGDSPGEAFSDRILILGAGRIGSKGGQGGQGILHERIRALLTEPGCQQFHGGRGGDGQVLHVLRQGGGILARHHGENVAHDSRRHPATGVLTETQRGAE